MINAVVAMVIILLVLGITGTIGLVLYYRALERYIAKREKELA